MLPRKGCLQGPFHSPLLLSFSSVWLLMKGLPLPTTAQAHVTPEVHATCRLRGFLFPYPGRDGAIVPAEVKVLSLL